MPAVVFFRLVEARGGIAVGASVKTGVVHPDVLADHAPAGFTLGGILRVIHLQPKDLPDLAVVNALPRQDSISRQILLLGATGESHAPVPRYSSHEPHQFSKGFFLAV